MKTFYDLLIELNACDPAINWAGDKPVEHVVKECRRGDWMLWLAKKLGVDKRKLTLAKALCAKTVIHLMKDERSKKAVEVAENYGNGLATDKELNAAAADAVDAAADAAASSSAASAAADAAYNNTADASYAGAYTAQQENRLKTSDICREVLGDIIIQKVKELLNK